MNILNHHFTLSYEKRMVDAEHAERLAEYNKLKTHSMYSKSCKTCGKYFVGRDWWLTESDYCSEQCELASYPKNKLKPIRRYEINLFWRDFGKNICLYDDWQPQLFQEG